MAGTASGLDIVTEDDIALTEAIHRHSETLGAPYKQQREPRKLQLDTKTDLAAVDFETRMITAPTFESGSSILPKPQMGSGSAKKELSVDNSREEQKDRDKEREKKDKPEKQPRRKSATPKPPERGRPSQKQQICHTTRILSGSQNKYLYKCKMLLLCGVSLRRSVYMRK